MKKSIFRGLFLTCLTLAVLSCGKEKSNIEKESKSEWIWIHWKAACGYSGRGFDGERRIKW